MKIEELRIGSILTYNGVNVKVEVINNEIGEVYVWGDDFYYNVELENLKPIPLTEEWLLNFGFEVEFDDPIKHARIGNNPVNRDSILKLTNCDADLENGIWFYRNGFHKIKHVNQLQNLYFALTGQELCEAR